MFTKFSKCEFLLEKIVFLRHVVSDEEIKVNPKKTEAVRNCPSNIRIFFGLTRYCRRFIEGFSTTSLPLTKMTQKERKVHVD